MYKLITLTLIALSTMMTGCTTVKYNAQADREFMDFPDLNTVNIVYVGDHMVNKGVAVTENVLRILKPMESMSYDVPAADYPMLGDDSTMEFYSSTGVTKNPLVDPHKALAVKKGNKGEVCIITVWNVASCRPGEFERGTRTVMAERSFQQTLIYNGRIGNKINIGYREFKNDLARAAFSNQVEYDLSESTTIGYKGALIEILEANNSSIKYRVIRNFP